VRAEEKVKLLSGVDLLEPLSWEEIEDLGGRVPEVHLERGQILYGPYHRSNVLFLLLRGRVRAYKIVGGRELTLRIVRAGETFGEAMLTRGRQGAYAQAIETSKIALISFDVLRRLVHDKPEVGLKAMRLLSERLSFYESKMADIGLKEVSARLASLVLHLVESEGVTTREGYRIPTRYTHEQLAAMVGAKRVAVTRAFAELGETGALELRQRYIYVTDVGALESVAGEGQEGRTL
jgi:CRP/FNR family transcriptional regulator